MKILYWIFIGWWLYPIQLLLKRKPKSNLPQTYEEQQKFLDEMFPETKRQMDYLDSQNEMLDRLSAAKQQYKVDNNLTRLISVYEELFVNSKPYLKSSQELDLANLYIKAGKNDKAWGYLNLLLSRGESPKHKIYSEQARILKKENKYEEAVRTYMLCHLYKAESGAYNQEAFLKDINVCVKKLKWSDAKVKRMTDILARNIQNRYFDAYTLSKEFKVACQETL